MWMILSRTVTLIKSFPDIRAIFIMMMIAQHNFCEACGKYEKIAGGGTGYIASPTNYGAYAYCMWWLETDLGYQLSINVTYVGDTNDGRCGDYVIIRDGKLNDDTSILLDESSSCSTLTNYIVTASASWLLVQFRSDGLNYTSGFQGYISSTYVGATITNFTSPIVDCNSYEWQCSNKVCMTLSYRCDNYNDCGCDEGCDEYECEGLGLGRYTLLGIAIAAGFGTFALFFVFALAYESHLKRRTLLNDPEAQAALQKEKEKKKRKQAIKENQKKQKGRR